MKTNFPERSNHYLAAVFRQLQNRINELEQMDPDAVVKDLGFLARAEWMVPKLLRLQYRIRYELLRRARLN